MKKLVSVIVPVYQAEKYIDRCVKSIVEQTYKNLEIILVDDGSTDNCPEICDQWADVDSRIKVIHKENGGLSSARNAGIDMAKGEFFGFVDSDDWIALDLFEKVMRVFDNHNPDIVTFDCNRINENGEIYTTTENIKEGVLSPERAIEELLKGNINNYAVNKVYKKQVFEGIRFPVGRLWEDMAIAYKLLLNAESIYCYPEKLYFYYSRQDSISKTISGKALGHIFLARYECHIVIKQKYLDLQKYSLSLVALSARRLFDRSLWEEVDSDILLTGKIFLAENKQIILRNFFDIKYWLFYSCPRVYVIVRVLKHKIGKIIKNI